MQPSYADYEYPPPPQDDPPQTQTQALVQETDVPMPPAAQQFTQRVSLAGLPRLKRLSLTDRCS